MYEQNFPLDEFLALPLRGANTVIGTVFGASESVKAIPPKVLEAAGIRGKIVHESIEQFIKTNVISIPMEHEIYMLNFIDWYEKYKPDFICSELKLYSYELGYKGIIDAIFVEDGEVIICDWKTSSSLDKLAATLQLNLYVKLFNNVMANILEYSHIVPSEFLNLNITKLKILSVTKTGYKYIDVPIDSIAADSILYLYKMKGRFETQ